MTGNGGRLNFSGLVEAIKQVHEHCASQAGKAINVSLTLRNWVIGCYILEYEQRGADRADYGERLLESLSDRLRHVGMSRVEPRELRRYRQFYVVYSRFWESLAGSRDSGLSESRIRPGRGDPDHLPLVHPLEGTHRNRRSAPARVLRGRVHSGQLVGARAQATNR